MISDRPPPRALALCPPAPFLRRRAPDVGLDPRAVDRLAARGYFTSPLHGVYQRADLPDSVTKSAGESQFRLRLLDAGFPPPQLQIPLLDHGGRQVFRLDLGYEEVRWAGESDGEQCHSGPEPEAHDRSRHLRIEREWGWNVLVVGKALVLGPSMALEYAVGEVLGWSP